MTVTVLLWLGGLAIAVGLLLAAIGLGAWRGSRDHVPDDEILW